mgnify:CR=1 FL=1
MFYTPDTNDHGLPFNPLKSCVVPRPIGWITTIRENGQVNLAPFSQFNLIGFEPAYVMFSANTHPPHYRPKNSTRNAERTGEFVYNMATWEMREDVVRSSRLMDPDTDDLQVLKLESAPGVAITTPHLACAPVAFECRHYSTLTLPGETPDTTHRVVIGRVVGVHIRDDALTEDGRLDIARLKPLTRLGYMDYSAVESVFEVELPEDWASASTRRKMMGGA